MALVPAVAEKYAALGADVLLERAAGQLSHIRDEDYQGVTLVDGDAQVLAADVVLKVDPPTPAEVGQMHEGTVVVGLLQPFKADDSIKALRDGKVTSFALELLPRITRAQSMDALTSQASIAGYKAVLMSACMAGRYYPMLTTPAGTLRPAKVLVLGVGVAGLQAIATARRLGAVVEAYDVRAATREQVQSLGGRFIDTGIDAEVEGGYARELTDEEKAKAKEIVDSHIVEADAVITTAAIPGRPSPKLITADVVDRMKSGAVIIDMAAEGGGNCELHPARRAVQPHERRVHLRAAQHPGHAAGARERPVRAQPHALPDAVHQGRRAGAGLGRRGPGRQRADPRRRHRQQGRARAHRGSGRAAGAAGPGGAGGGDRGHAGRRPASPEAPEAEDAARHEAAGAPPAPDDAPGEQGGAS